MNVTVIIDGREAIPIRAIPFITGWRIAADLVVSILAHRDPWELRRTLMSSWHLSADGQYSSMFPKEWDGIAADLKVLMDKLRAEQQVGRRNYAVWRRDSIPLLPSACFVWKDDFEAAFVFIYSDLSYEIVDERPGDRELNFSPYVPPELEKLVMEGFRKTTKPLLASGLGVNYETPLLRLIEAAVKKWCFLRGIPAEKDR